MIEIAGEPESTPTNRLLSVQAVADACGVSIRTVYRWLARDGLSVHRLPGTGARSIIRIAQADLSHFLNHHRHDPEMEKALGSRTMRLSGTSFLPTKSSFSGFRKTQLDPVPPPRSRVPAKEDTEP